MTDDSRHLDIESLVITGGRDDTGALAPTLWPSSAFEVGSVDEMRVKATGRRADRFYSRYANPTVSAFEAAVAELEGAEAALAFASGMGALSSVVLALCSTGSHIVAQRHIYSGTQLILHGVCPRFGIDVDLVDSTEPGALSAAVRPGQTMLVIAETPANPQLALADLDELGSITGPFTLVDSTFAPPVIQRPIRHGVDLVVHSATKGIAGHNDATLGVLSGARDLIDEIWAYSVLHGASASPWDAMNGLRGIRTLAVRVNRQSESALRLAEFFESRPEVSLCLYPHLASHPQYELAKRQMSTGGSMVAVELTGGLEAGRRFVERCRLARIAATLGGPETLVVHPASSTHVALSEAEQRAIGITPGLVRISVGLEHPEDLITDFSAALGG